MALSSGLDGFVAAINHFHWFVQVPCSDNQKRLERKIELCAESAAHGGGDDAHVIFSNPENRSDVFAIGVGRLSARLHFDAISDSAGKTGFRFDVGVLDEARFVISLD